MPRCWCVFSQAAEAKQQQASRPSSPAKKMADEIKALRQVTKKRPAGAQASITVRSDMQKVRSAVEEEMKSRHLQASSLGGPAGIACTPGIRLHHDHSVAIEIRSGDIWGGHSRSVMLAQRCSCWWDAACSPVVLQHVTPLQGLSKLSALA